MDPASPSRHKHLAFSAAAAFQALLKLLADQGCKIVLCHKPLGEIVATCVAGGGAGPVTFWVHPAGDQATNITTEMMEGPAFDALMTQLQSRLEQSPR